MGDFDISQKRRTFTHTSHSHIHSYWSKSDQFPSLRRLKRTRTEEAFLECLTTPRVRLGEAVVPPWDGMEVSKSLFEVQAGHHQSGANRGCVVELLQA